ncbi:MAG: hypothetical protein AB8B93_01975 [Pseudomonadales bacterium]
MKLQQWAARIIGTAILGCVAGAATAAETIHMPGSACQLATGSNAVERTQSDLVVSSDWAEIVCPMPSEAAITRIQVNTSGIASGEAATTGCNVDGGDYRRSYGNQNRFIYTGTSLSDVSCMLRRGHKVRSLQVTVR